MTNQWLLDTIGHVDADLVERAAEQPAVRPMRTIKWTAAVAAVLVLAVSLGILFGNGFGKKPPMGPPLGGPSAGDVSDTTTTDTTTTTTTTTTEKTTTTETTTTVATTAITTTQSTTIKPTTAGPSAGKPTAATNSMPPLYRYAPHVPTVEAVIDFVKNTEKSAYDGNYESFLDRTRSVGVCVPRYQGKYLEHEERGIALMLETGGEAPGFFYYFPEGIVRCYYIEEGLADEAKEQLAFFKHGVAVKGMMKEALEEASSKGEIETDNVILSDGRKVVCSLHSEDDRKKATFLLNENILITVDVFNRYQLSPKAVINDLSFEIIEVTTPTTSSVPATSGEDIFINEGEYFAQGGKRLVDRTEPIPKEEFLKKYPVSLPRGFSTVTLEYEIPTEDGLRLNKNMSENGFIRCESKDGKGSMYAYVCQTGYIALSCVWRPDNEPQKSRINNIDVIISRQGKNVYKGRFEKDGYYYTFKMSNVSESEMISALKDLTG